MKFQDAIEQLRRGRGGKKKLGNNTYLHETQDGIAVRLHNTDIVTIHPDNTYTLNSGGWRTVTTKARINEHSPARLGQDKGIWYLYVGAGRGWSNERVVFHDGVKVDANGLAVGPAADDTADVEAKKHKLDKLAREYVNGFAADAVANGGLKQPSNGDCWGCLFTAQAHQQTPYMGVNLATVDVKESEPMGVDHLLQHFEEQYYVPALLWKAIHSRGYRDPSLIWHMLDSDVKRGNVTLLKDILRAYFRKRKPALLEAM